MVAAPTAVVTGATSGFGLAAARHLAATGYDLVLVARSAERAGRVADELSPSGAAVDVVIADLSSIEETDRAGRAIADRHERLDLLLNNAGAIFGLRRRESADGIEMTMALNHFGYVGLTRRVVDRVSSDSGRIINVASDAYSFAKGPFDFDDWQATSRYRLHRQYGRSKLANILYTRALASRLADRGVSVAAWSPDGLTATRFAYGAHPLAPLAMKLTHPFATSVDKAAESLLDLCTGPFPADGHGQFFVDRTIDTVDVASDDDAERLWELTEEILLRATGGE